jgi:hypothetical protein
LKDGTEDVIQEMLEQAEDRVRQDWWQEREIAD